MIIVCSLLSFAYAYAVVMEQDLKNLWTIWDHWDQKKTLFFQQKVYGLERWLTNCSKAKMKGVLGVWLPPKKLETLLGKNPPPVGKCKNFEMDN